MHCFDYLTIGARNVQVQYLEEGNARAAGMEEAIVGRDSDYRSNSRAETQNHQQSRLGQQVSENYNFISKYHIYLIVLNDLFQIIVYSF